MTQKEMVLAALMNGEELTAKQIKSRFNVGNPYAVIQNIRFDGYAVYLNEGKTDSRGRTRASKYRLGTPSRAVVAAGYRALASGAV